MCLLWAEWEALPTHKGPGRGPRRCKLSLVEAGSGRKGANPTQARVIWGIH